MTKEQAIQILIQVAMLAQKGGVLSLKDAATTATAIDVLRPQPPENITEKEPEPETKEPVSNEAIAIE